MAEHGRRRRGRIYAPYSIRADWAHMWPRPGV